MTATPEIILTEGQQNALDAIYQFLLDPKEVAFVLSGFSGCGKTTLVRTLLDKMPDFFKAIKLVNPAFKEYELMLTATTNKAAENLYRISGTTTSTIHSALGIMVMTDYKTRQTKLTIKKNQINYPLTHHILFIDEASYVDKELLGLIFKMTRDCKIIFVGDPAQLAPVKSQNTPVFEASFASAALTEVVRQAKGNPIIDLATNFRHTVNTGEWMQFTPDNHHVHYLNQEDFLKEIEKEFTRPDWEYLDSKILAWTNKKVIEYNNAINSLRTGDPKFKEGDYAVCNSYVSYMGHAIKTDELVEILSISENTYEHGILGNWYTVTGYTTWFMPKHLSDKKALLNQYHKDEQFASMAVVEETWIDLRGAAAQTVNKSQGSTYGKVFIDLDDINRCNNGEQIARMLYVAVSRARDQVYLTGNIT